MREIFYDPKLEDDISNIGFVKISGFLSPDVCDELTTYFQENQIADDRAFSISNWNNDLQHRTNTFTFIKEKIFPLANQYLKSYLPVMGVYTVKHPGNNSDMLLHQDWSLVDESQYRSVSVWVALNDMDHRNGNLQLAVKSHLYCGFPRGMNIPVPFEDIRQELHDRLINVPLQKGDAIIFDHRVIHASPVNASNSIRLAAVLALIPDDTEVIHYYKHPGNDSELEILAVNNDDFHLIDFFDMPNKPLHSHSIKKISTHFDKITMEDVNSVVPLEYDQI